MKGIFAEIAATNWRDWLETAVELAGAALIVTSITLAAIGFAPTI